MKTDKIILISFIFLICLIFLYLLVCLIYRHFFPVFLKDEHKRILYEGMNKVHNILKENDIPYFAICGTLLGAIRDKEIIPWDDDIDIGIFEGDMDKFNNIDFDYYGYEMKPVLRSGIGKIYITDKCYIDIFAFENVKLNNNSVYQYVHESARKAWPKEYFKVEEMFPLKMYKFGDIEISGPNKFEPYAKRVWGKWKKPVFKIPKIFIYPFDFGRIYLTKKYKPLKDEE